MTENSLRFDISLMDPEKTYRVDHIFRPLTGKQVEEYKQQLSHMEKQFSIELERFKAEGPRPKPAPKPIPSHTSKDEGVFMTPSSQTGKQSLPVFKPKREKLKVKFEEQPLEQQLSNLKLGESELF